MKIIRPFYSHIRGVMKFEKYTFAPLIFMLSGYFIGLSFGKHWILSIALFFLAVGFANLGYSIFNMALTLIDEKLSSTYHAKNIWKARAIRWKSTAEDWRQTYIDYRKHNSASDQAIALLRKVDMTPHDKYYDSGLNYEIAAFLSGAEIKEPAQPLAHCQNECQEHGGYCVCKASL